ncbi:MAG TPA: type II toxin-antitoxin system RelE/ParE family toxin [Caulobacteraceae bacterium]
MRLLRLSSRARADIAEAARWSEANWGRRQRVRYVTDLLERLAKLPARPRVGALYSPEHPGVRRLRIGAHLAFYRFDDERVLVICVLDQRMDLAAQLRRALGDD